MAKKDVIFAMATEGGRIKSTFWQCGSRPIKINRKRKRAIERARYLTRMGTIEVGDTVEIIDNSMHGFETGSIVYVAQKDRGGDFLLSSVLEDDNSYSLNTRWHLKEDVKLIKKGTK